MTTYRWSVINVSILFYDIVWPPQVQFKRMGEKKSIALPQGDPVNQLMQIMLLQQLGQMQKPAEPRQQGPVEDEGEDYLWR